MIKKWLVAVTTVALAAAALADEQRAGPDPKQVYLFGGGSYYWSPDDSGLDHAFGPAVGVGYAFADRWAGELLYSRHELGFELPGGSGHDKSDLIQLDFLREFSGNRNWQPFAIGGIGRTKSRRGSFSDFDDTQLNAGLGVYRSLGRRFALRGDLRGVYSFEEGGLEPFALIGLTLNLGGTQAPAADSDGDGVADGRDACPGTPMGAGVDGRGCELDGDGDGVVDRLDRCPNTPPGAPVDERGCALDSDADGVPDYRDDCPDTAQGARVDERGCYIELEETVTIDLNLEFDTNSTVLRPDHAAEIGRAVEFLRQYPTADAVIEGHTDSDGAAGYNQTLSERRAAAVRDYLIEEANIDASRLSSVGLGESRPVASNATREGKQQNRRVSVVVSGTQTVRQ